MTNEHDTDQLEFESPTLCEEAVAAPAQEHGSNPFACPEPAPGHEQKRRFPIVRLAIFVLGFGGFAAGSLFMFFGGMGSPEAAISASSPALSSPQIIPHQAPQSVAQAPIPQAAAFPAAQPPAAIAPHAQDQGYPGYPYPAPEQPVPAPPAQAYPPAAATDPYSTQATAYAPAPGAPGAQAWPPAVPGGNQPFVQQPGPASTDVTLDPAQAPLAQEEHAAPALPATVSAPAPAVAVPAVAAQNEEILQQLREIKEGMQTTCEPDDEAAEANPKELQALAEAKDFLLKDNRDLREKNNFLRKEERKYRLMVQELETKLKEAEKAKVAAAKAPKAEKAVTAEAAPAKKTGPALPPGWEIKGMVSNFVSLENKAKLESALLEIGDEIEGVRILGINVEKNLVITSNGVATAKF